MIRADVSSLYQMLGTSQSFSEFVPRFSMNDESDDMALVTPISFVVLDLVVVIGPDETTRYRSP